MVKEIIKKALSEVVKEINGTINLEFSADEKNGHLATNCALVFGKERGMSPKEFAQKTKDEIEPKLKNVVERIEIAGPGFINFFLTNEAIINELKEVEEKINKGFKYLEGKKINIEFISANPTGELHIGHGRGAFYGDALSNILQFAGAEVTREYFINDSRESNQIKELGKTALGEGETYLTEKLKTQIAKIKTGLIHSDILENIRMNSRDVSEAGFKLAEVVQKNNQEFIENKLGIKFNIWYSEDEKLRASKLNDRTFLTLKTKELTHEKDGAVWIKTSEYGDDEDRVIVRSDGTNSYFLSDIAYHGEKFSRGYDKVIDIWGADHHGHVKRMEAVKKMLDWSGEFKIFITQLVSLKDGDNSSKMSKRAGNVVYLEELVDEFGIDVVRWFYNEKSISTHMEFDIARAKEQSEKNPVFYVQYAHARTNSILEKAKNFKKDETSVSEVIQIPSARALALKLVQISEIIESITKEYQVQKLTTYSYELAGAFSQFYRDVRVIEENSYSHGALAIVEATKKTLAKSLFLLGISAPEKM
ncbi:MAG: arginine--tRNA ligase [Patescibacteria group bacterium]